MAPSSPFTCFLASQFSCPHGSHLEAVFRCGNEMHSNKSSYINLTNAQQIGRISMVSNHSAIYIIAIYMIVRIGVPKAIGGDLGGNHFNLLHKSIMHISIMGVITYSKEI